MRARTADARFEQNTPLLVALRWKTTAPARSQPEFRQVAFSGRRDRGGRDYENYVFLLNRVALECGKATQGPPSCICSIMSGTRQRRERRSMKALIPAAGLGTRFLPATKAQPKEMLLVVDRPAIQYVVEEGLASGADEVVIVNSREKKAIEDHFTPNRSWWRFCASAARTPMPMRWNMSATCRSATCIRRRRWGWDMPCAARQRRRATSRSTCCSAMCSCRAMRCCRL